MHPRQTYIWAVGGVNLIPLASESRLKGVGQLACYKAFLYFSLRKWTRNSHILFTTWKLDGSGVSVSIDSLRSSCINIKTDFHIGGYFGWDFLLKFLFLVNNIKKRFDRVQLSFLGDSSGGLRLYLNRIILLFSCVSLSRLITDWARWGTALWTSGMWYRLFFVDFSLTDHEFLFSYPWSLSELLSFLCDMSSVEDVVAIIYQSVNLVKFGVPSFARENIERGRKVKELGQWSLDNRECSIRSHEDLWNKMKDF